MIVDGSALAREIRGQVQACLADLVARGGDAPRVAIVQVGGSAEGALYTRQLQRTFGRAGVDVDICPIPENASLGEAVRAVGELSRNPSIHGIQIQAPLPPNVPLPELAEALDPAKDLDGLHPANAGLLAQGRPWIIPATPLAGIEILLRYGVQMAGSRAVVVGRSTLVGRPMALLLLQHDATVTICHSRTRSLGAMVQEADILVVAAGRPGLIAADMIRPGAAVIDFGVNVMGDKIVGDVEPAAARRAGLFTPVPGGTGPVTTAMLLRNALILYQHALEAKGR